MKYRNSLIILLTFLGLVLISQDLMAQGIAKEMTVGYLRYKVVDQADEGEGSWGWGSHSMFWDGYSENSLYSSKAVMLGCKNFEGPRTAPGGIHISGHGQWEVDDQHILIPVSDEAGNTINRYYRSALPELVVDGLPISTFFPQNSADHIAPDKIPGTADGLIESYVHSDMGVSFRQRAIGFSQQNHNKYVIKEYIFKNTGIIGFDEDGNEIMRTEQTIDDFYFLKQLRYQEWPQRPWASAVGQYEGDEIRMIYGYPSREPEEDIDILGAPNFDANGYLTNPIFMGEALLFASAAPNDMVNDHPNQFHMTGYTDVDFESFTFHSWNMNSGQKTKLYEVMENGLANIDGINWPELVGTVENTHHGVPLDELGIPYITEMPGFGYSSSGCYSIGPYDLAPGDSIKIVIADCIGGISPEVAREVSEKWWNNEDPGAPEGWESDDKLPKQYQDFPELYEADEERDEIVNLNKDKWVLTGRDSLFKTARAAMWAYENNYNVPAPPPAVSVSVLGLADGIRVEWGNEADSHPGLDGFNVYRAEGNFYPGVPYGEADFIGVWEKVYTASPGEHEFIDESPSRAVAYFYSVTAFDDGNAGTDFDGNAHVLESNPFNSVTTFSANLQREGGTLESVVIVPNPYNVAANTLLYPGENNKIAFLDVPAECTIRIFTESGDLIKTIEHEGSGDAYWGDIPNDHQTTETGQLVVSGVYIAHFETPDGKSKIKKFVIIR